jgi:hypothetical protein
MALTRKCCARNSFRIPTINPTVSLSSRKYSVLGHKHPGYSNKNRRRKTRVPIHPLLMELNGNFWSENLFRILPAVNPTMTLASQKYSDLGHKHLSPSNKNPRRKRLVPIHSLLMKLTGNFCAQNSFCISCVNPTVSMASKKYSVLGHKHFRPSNKNSRRKRRFPIYRLLMGLTGNFCA